MADGPTAARQLGRPNHDNTCGDIVMATQTLAQRQTVINPWAQRNVIMQRRHFELIAEIIAKELDGECRENDAGPNRSLSAPALA